MKLTSKFKPSINQVLAIWLSVELMLIPVATWSGAQSPLFFWILISSFPTGMLMVWLRKNGETEPAKLFGVASLAFIMGAMGGAWRSVVCLWFS